MQVGILGGTGPAGQALAARLAKSGCSVMIGSRSIERSEEIVGGLQSKWDGHHLELIVATNEQAARAEIVVLATPWEAAVQTVSDLRDALSGQVVVSMVNALSRVGKEFQPIFAARGSIAATLQAALPESRVTAAFQHLPAGDLSAIDRPIRADVLVCADDDEAAASTRELVESIPGLRAFHCGSLASANAIEAMTAALLNVNIRYKTHAALRIEPLAVQESGAGQ